MPLSMELTSLQAALLFCRLPNLGPRSAKKLIDECGSAKNILQEESSKLLKINGIGQSHLAGISQWKSVLPQLEKEEKFLQKKKLTPFVYGQKDYPITLTHINDPPPVFFQKGTVNWENKRVISIVGTRKPTARGIAFCQQLIEEISPYSPLIVSGFARGIDIVAHRKALEMGLETVAVIAHAYDQWYPKEHQVEVEKLLNNGAFVTEFWSDAPFERANFLKRNRIIAGLSHATIVIESGEKGGSLVTASHALAYGREVFAPPGRVSDPQSKGCLNLLKADRARLITCAADLATWLEWEKKTAVKTVQKSLFVDLSKEETALYDLLKDPLSLDEIALKTKRSVGQVAAELMQMELKGVVRSLAGKRFEQF